MPTPAYVTANVDLSAGTAGAERYAYSRESGHQTVLEFTGRKTEALYWYSAWINLGCSPVRCDPVGSEMYRTEAVVAAAPGDSIHPASPDDRIVTKWTVPGNMLEKDIYDCSPVRAAFDQMGTAVSGAYSGDLSKVTQSKVIMRGLIDALAQGLARITYTGLSDTEVELTGLSVNTVLGVAEFMGMNSTNRGVLRQLIDDRANGVDKWPVPQWVLKKSMSGPLTSSLKGVRTNVGKMLATSFMTSGGGENVPSTLLDGIPDGYWLKNAPTVDVESDRIRVEYEWWWSLTYARTALGDPVT